jgi:hypothetical protein
MRALSAGSTSACTVVMPTAWARTAALPALSPVSRTERTPKAPIGARPAPHGAWPCRQRPAGPAGAAGLAPLPRRTPCGRCLPAPAAQPARGPGPHPTFLHPAQAALAQGQAFDICRHATATHGAQVGGHGSARPSSVATCSTARPSGWLLPACSAAAAFSNVAARSPSAASTCTSCGRPCVNVPVLSQATTPTACATSSASASLIRMPRCAATPVPCHDGRRCGQAQRTGAGNDQHGHGVDHRHRPSRTRQTPAQQREQGHGQHGRHEDRADTVHQALDGRLAGLRRFHQPHDARQRALGAHRGGAHQQQAIAIDGAPGDGIARPARHRQAFAGDQRLVDVAVAFITTPSTAMRSPARTTTRSPTTTCASGTSTSPAALRTRAVSGRKALKARMAAVVCRRARASSHLPSSTRVMTTAELSKYRPWPAIGPQRVQAQAIGRTGAQRHQQVHVAGAGPQGSPTGLVEARAQPELHRRRQCQLPEAVEHPVAAPQHGQHGQGQRGRQQRGQQHTAAIAQPGLRAGPAPPAARPRRSRRV